MRAFNNEIALLTWSAEFMNLENDKYLSIVGMVFRVLERQLGGGLDRRILRYQVSNRNAFEHEVAYLSKSIMVSTIRLRWGLCFDLGRLSRSRLGLSWQRRPCRAVQDARQRVLA